MIKPKKTFRSPTGGSETGPGRGISNSSFGTGIKVAPRSVRKKAATVANKPIKVKSGGNVQPATAKKTIANNPAGVGKAPSPSRVKWDLETAKLGARKGKTVKINSAPKRTSGNR